MPIAGSLTAVAGLLAWFAVALAETQSPPLEEYRIDAGASDIHWRIYRAGAFSGLGHNHVISVGELSGWVRRGPAGEASSFELTIPVDGLIVDDPKLRERYGEPFSSEPSAEDVAGTRKNMLGKKVLRGGQHPVIRVSGSLPDGPEGTELAVSVELLGRTVDFSVPCEIRVSDGVLTASGQFSLTHEDLGLRRFKVMLGALSVAKEIDFSYRVRAVRGEPASATPAKPRTPEL